ncbi:MAG: hypothetical protein WB580_01995 [Candidatus Binataceae bacterium]
MATHKRVEANEKNPRSAPRARKRKGISTTAALKSAVTGKDIVILGEHPRKFDKFRSTLIADIAPQSALEQFFAEKAAFDAWRLMRMTRFETALYRREERNLRLETAESEMRSYETPNRALEFVKALSSPGIHKGTFWKHHAAETKFEKLEAEPKPPMIRFVELLEPRWATFLNLERYGSAISRSFTRCLFEVQRLQAMRSVKRMKAPAVWEP